jgi:hypothetical protein
MELKLGSIHTLVISSPKMAKEVLKTHVLAFACRYKSIIYNFQAMVDRMLDGDCW